MISKSLEVFKIAFHKRNAIEGLQSEPCPSMRAIFPHQLCLKMDSRVLGKCTTVCFWSIFDFRTHWYQSMQSKTHLATQWFTVVRIIKWLVHFQNSLWRSLWETITLLEPSPPSSETSLRQFSVLKKKAALKTISGLVEQKSDRRSTKGLSLARVQALSLARMPQSLSLWKF